MAHAYPAVLTKTKDGYLVSIPDFQINTQGHDVPEAIFMARDAIGLMGIDMEDEGKKLPVPSDIEKIPQDKNDILTLVDIDFCEYRRITENKSVRKNVTIPGWLNVKAEEAGINFSKTLQDALIGILDTAK